MFEVKSRCIGCVLTVSTLEVIICNIWLRILRLNNVLFLKIIFNGGGEYLSMFPIELLGVEIYPAKSARNLGVIFDKNFNFRSHISAMCSSCIYHIQDLRHIHRHLDLDSAKLLANALVSSHLHYL